MRMMSHQVQIWKDNLFSQPNFRICFMIQPYLNKLMVNVYKLSFFLVRKIRFVQEKITHIFIPIHMQDFVSQSAFIQGTTHLKFLGSIQNWTALHWTILNTVLICFINWLSSVVWNKPIKSSWNQSVQLYTETGLEISIDLRPENMSQNVAYLD